MTSVACPKCNEPVRVPDDCSPSDQLRCPCCREEFPASAVNEQLPPMLEVVSSDAADAAGAGPTEAGPAESEMTEVTEASEGNGGGWEKLADLAEASDSPEEADGGAFSFDTGDDAGATNSAAVRAARYPNKNPAVEFAKIAAGGVLAVPIALFILLWLGRDVLNVGPTIGTYLPWLVPAQYRAAGADDADSAVADNARSSGPGGSVFRDGNVVAPPPLPDDPDGPGGPDGTEGTKGADGKRTEKTVAVSGIRDAPTITSQSLADAVDQAERAWNVWSAASEEDSIDPQVATKLKESLYDRLCELGEATVFVEAAPGKVDALAERASRLMERISQDADLLPWIGNRARETWDAARRPVRGAILFGTVGKHSKRGASFVTELTLAAKKKTTVDLVSITDPSDTFKAGDRILVLGVIVDRPGDLLVGYDGEAARVVVGGLPFRMKPSL